MADDIKADERWTWILRFRATDEDSREVEQRAPNAGSSLGQTRSLRVIGRKSSASRRRFLRNKASWGRASRSFRRQPGLSLVNQPP